MTANTDRSKIYPVVPAEAPLESIQVFTMEQIEAAAAQMKADFELKDKLRTYRSDLVLHMLLTGRLHQTDVAERLAIGRPRVSQIVASMPYDGEAIKQESMRRRYSK